jgi:hypothetical protein
MLPDIGLMIGFYIVLRCADIGMRPGQHVVVRLLAVLTLFVAVIGIVDLAMRGITAPSQ